VQFFFRGPWWSGGRLACSMIRLTLDIIANSKFKMVPRSQKLVYKGLNRDKEVRGEKLQITK